MYDIFVLGNNPNWKKIKSKYPFAKKVETFTEAKTKSLTSMFWTVWDDIEVQEDFDFTYSIPKWDEEYVHVFKNSNYFDGVSLIPKNKHLSQKEIQYRWFVDKKEIDTVASVPKKYDIFEIETYEQYLEAMEKSSTDMFWMTSPNIKIADDFKFDLYITHHNAYERQENHAFVHLVNDEKLYNGVFLLSKYKPLSAKEIEHRYIVDRKEWDVIASIPCQYDIFEIETYEQYQHALKNSSTEMFWMTTPNLQIVDDFKFDTYFSHDQIYDRNENHAFAHLVNDEKLYNGIFLLSKHRPVSAKEIEHRYIVERKEWDIVASGPVQYEIFTVDTYEQYQHAMTTSKTEMFYIVPSDINVLDDFKFDIYYTHDKEFERKSHHALLNGVFYDGIFLVSKHVEISQKEIDSKFITVRVEEDILATLPVKFDKFAITSYQDYLDACNSSTTNMFWAIWSDVEVVEDFDFEYYVPRYNQHITHVFKNDSYFDGVCLFNKTHKVNEREFKYRFFSEKKEVDYVISYPKPYDIFEIETYDQYLEAMTNSATDMFWMTTPNVKIADDFKFDVQCSRFENHAFVHLVNDEKLYNGIFLLSKHKPVTNKEIEHRYIVDRKEWDIVASEPCKYDKFIVETYAQYLEAMSNSKTEMFWAVSNNIKINDNFEFDLYFSHDRIYDRKENHAFIHLVNERKLFSGVYLLSKHTPVSAKEINHRYIIDRKEWDVVASGPCQYDRFIVDTYQDYLTALTESRTEMFYIIPSDVNVSDDFKFDIYYSHDKEFERTIHHALLNGDFYDGIFLTSKHSEISQKEIDNKFITTRVEEDILASNPIKFDKFEIATYQDYVDACKKSTTNVFWAVWPDVEVVDDFDFEYYVPRYNQHITHVFKNGSYFDGICLFNKDTLVNEREFKYRFFSEKKEVDYVISYPKQYDIFEIETYEQYLEAMSKSSTDMFWMTTPNVKIADNFKFDVQCSRFENHAFVHLVNNEKLYNGIFLLSKHKPVSAKEIEHRYIVERKEWDIIASGPCKYDKFIVDTYEQYQYALTNSKTELFYMIPSDIHILDDFKFDMYYSHDKEFERKSYHALLNGDYYDGIYLASKHIEISQKEIDNKFIVERKEEEILASTPIKFDVCYINSYEDYVSACEDSTTPMFWAVWPDVEVVEDFEFDYYVPRYNQHIAHVFKNGDYFDGVCLFNKHSRVNEREFKYRFFSEKKEIDYVISYPKPYDTFTVDTYEQYLEAKTNSTTDLFWIVPTGLKILDNFKLDLYYTHHDTYNRTINHVFRNGDFYDGIMLTPREQEISKKEFNSWFVINRKEHDELASMPTVFDKFEITTYNDYLTAVEKSTTGMFWAVWTDVDVVEDFEFDYYVPRYNQHITHVFKNGEHLDGICLFSKHYQISKKEFKHRFFNEKKEVDYIASYPKKYDTFRIRNYDDYVNALATSSTDMFWMIPNEVEELDTFTFDTYFSHHNTYDRNINHSFKHLFRGEENYNGINLMSKNVPVSEKEITFRYLVERKEWDITASKVKPYDIVFISYNESNADENFDRINALYPRVKRVHGVKGIHQAHIKAAEQATTDNFWVVDGDAIVVDEFKFDYEIPVWEYNTVHVWRSQNPVNNLVYGYGGVKLLPRQLTLDMDVTRPDMTTSISDKFKPVQVVSNVTAFNTDEFSTWKSAFRECAKLAGKTIDRQVDTETEERLTVWCTEGADKPFGEFAIKGALAGRKFATDCPEDLFKINDFDWLYEQYEKDCSK